MNGNPVQLQAEFRNSMTFIVQRVADDPDPEPEVVLRHLVEKLGEFLGADSGRITAVWRGSGARFGVEWMLSAETPQILTRETLAAVEHSSLGEPVHSLLIHPIMLQWWGTPYHMMRIAPGRNPDDHILEIGFEPPGDNVRWEWLMRYVRGLSELHHTVRGLLGARIDRAREVLKAQIHGFHLSRAVPIQVNLAAALRVLPRLLALGVLDLVEELLVSLSLHMFGLGRRIRTVRRETAARLDAHHPTSLIRALVDQIRECVQLFPHMPTGRISTLVGCFAAVIAPEVAGAPLPGQDVELTLLSTWTRIHELVREPRMGQAADVAWLDAFDATQLALAQILQRSVKQHRVDSTREWMTIWFCLELLSEVSTTGDDVELRAELAYVLRELLRSRLFGGRKDYFHDQEALTDSLVSLVFQHAKRVVKLPASYISNLLRLIRREGGENRYSVTDHLQHVADVYIAGHFFLSLEIKRSGQRTRAVEMLAGYAVDAAVQEQLAAFSLAAIFHDVGHVFLPTEPHVVLTTLAEDAVVRVLRDRASASQKLAQSITECCMEELALTEVPQRPHGRLYLEPTVRDAAVRWFIHQAGKGRADHALLSAWHLHRVCEGVRESRRETAESRKYAAIAVRAILLHDIDTVEIDAGRDPVAALLVLCNEVFEWAPSRRAQPDAARARDHDHTTRRLERTTELSHLRIEPGTSRSAIVLEADTEGAWPSILIELMPHEYVDRPILAIWLNKAQAIGRIKPGVQSGFGPTMRIRSYRDPALAHCDLSTWQVLRQALGDCNYPEIAEWCQTSKQFRVIEKPGASAAEPILMEEVRLGYLREQLCSGGLDTVVPAITQLVDDFVKRRT